MGKLIGGLLALLTLVGICYGVLFWMDERYASSKEVVQIAQRLDYKIMADQLQSIQERIWRIEDRYRNKPMDDTAREELRQLRELKAQIEKKINKMEGK